LGVQPRIVGAEQFNHPRHDDEWLSITGPPPPQQVPFQSANKILCGGGSGGAQRKSAFEERGRA
jgi:hypothetical protein